MGELTISLFHRFTARLHRTSTLSGRNGHHPDGLPPHRVSTFGTTPSVTRQETSMLPSRFLPRHLAGAALACTVVAAPRTTPAQMYVPPSAPIVVSTDWLAKHLKDPNLVLLHV